MTSDLKLAPLIIMVNKTVCIVEHMPRKFDSQVLRRVKLLCSKHAMIKKRLDFQLR